MSSLDRVTWVGNVEQQIATVVILIEQGGHKTEVVCTEYVTSCPKAAAQFRDEEFA